MTVPIISRFCHKYKLFDIFVWLLTDFCLFSYSVTSARSHQLCYFLHFYGFAAREKNRLLYAMSYYKIAMLDPIIIHNKNSSLYFASPGDRQPSLNIALTARQSCRINSRALRANLGGSRSCSGSGGVAPFVPSVLVLAFGRASVAVRWGRNCLCSTVCRATVWAKNSSKCSPLKQSIEGQQKL